MSSSLYFLSAMWDGFANLLCLSLMLFSPFLYSLKEDFRDSVVILKMLVAGFPISSHLPMFPHLFNLFYLYRFLVLFAKEYISL